MEKANIKTIGKDRVKNSDWHSRGKQSKNREQEYAKTNLAIGGLAENITWANTFEGGGRCVERGESQQLLPENSLASTSFWGQRKTFLGKDIPGAMKTQNSHIHMLWLISAWAPSRETLCMWCFSLSSLWGQMLRSCCAFLLTYRFSFLQYNFFHCVSQSLVFVSIDESIANMTRLSASHWLVMDMQSFLSHKLKNTSLATLHRTGWSSLDISPKGATNCFALPFFSLLHHRCPDTSQEHT